MQVCIIGALNIRNPFQHRAILNVFTCRQLLPFKDKEIGNNIHQTCLEVSKLGILGIWMYFHHPWNMCDRLEEEEVDKMMEQKMKEEEERKRTKEIEERMSLEETKEQVWR